MNIFLFTRDLRIPDNTGLLECLKDTERPLLCIFCFDTQQIGKNNEYRSDNAIDFMIESLQDLHTSLSKEFSKGKLHCFKGSKPEVIEHLLQSFQDNHTHKDKDKDKGTLHMSSGFTPFEVKMERQLREVCEKYQWTLSLHEDFLLWDGARTTTPASGEMFTRYTPFMRTAFSQKHTWRKPQKIPNGKHANFFTFSSSSSSSSKMKIKEVSLEDIQKEINQTLKDTRRISPQRIVKGGRTSALKRIAYLLREHRLDRYAKTRNDLSTETSQLSAYHKFGCISPRETHSFFSNTKYRAFTQELLWRDYAYHRLANWPKDLPDITSIGKQVKWPNPVPGSGSPLFKAWKEGRTGVPIVDAGMRQLLQEGYIHNRARMVVAQYLIKILQVDWRLGEQHFAQWLTDYDWSVNFMNWLLISAIMSTEQVSRYMNPYIQMKKFDPDCQYIFKYVPELQLDSKSDKYKEHLKNIFDETRNTEIQVSGKPPYPKPIVSYTQSIQKYRKWAGSYLKRTRKQHPQFKSSKRTRKQTRK
jgi:deoxyribodipyrimidine photo-lyase